jgi:hypothetical protein
MPSLARRLRVDDGVSDYLAIPPPAGPRRAPPDTSGHAARVHRLRLVALARRAEMSTADLALALDLTPRHVRNLVRQLDALRRAVH